MGSSLRLSPETPQHKKETPVRSRRRGKRSPKDNTFPKPPLTSEGGDVAPKSPSTGEERDELKQLTTLSGHFRSKNSGSLQPTEERSEITDDSSNPPSQTTFVQFDPTNPDLLSTVNIAKDESATTTETIKRADGTVSKFEIKEFSNLPNFEIDSVPHSQRSLPVGESNDLSQSISSLQLEEVGHKTSPRGRARAGEGIRATKSFLAKMNKSMNLSVNLNLHHPSGHQALLDEGDSDDE